jgi:hypothetical protein
MDAPYWTDGQRAVFILGDEPTALDGIRLLGWDVADDPAAPQWREDRDRH